MTESRLIHEDANDIDETQVLANNALISVERGGLQSIPQSQLPSLTRPDIVQMMERRVQVLGNLRKAAIKATVPSDWTLFKAGEGKVSGIAGRAGCTKIGQVYGIQVLNPTPVNIFTDAVGKTVAECHGDGYCALTGQYLPGLRGYRVQGEQFTGRSEDKVGQQDLIQSARTALENKAVRALSGLVKVDLVELAAVFGLSPADFEAAASRGAGYGSATDRAQGGAASAGSDANAISDAQRKRAYAIASKRAEFLAVEGVDAKVILNHVGRDMGIKGDPSREQYERFVANVEAFNVQGVAS